MNNNKLKQLIDQLSYSELVDILMNWELYYVSLLVLISVSSPFCNPVYEFGTESSFHFFQWLMV